MSFSEPLEALIGLFIVGAILGYGLLLHALRDQVKPVPESLGTALYLAGTSLLTIGFGDYVPIGGLARLLSLVAGATGLGIYAVTITLLYSLYGSFQRRE